MSEYQKVEISWYDEAGTSISHYVGVRGVIRIWGDSYPTGSGDEPTGSVEQIKVAFSDGQITVYNQAHLPEFTVYPKKKKDAV